MTLRSEIMGVWTVLTALTLIGSLGTVALVGSGDGGDLLIFLGWMSVHFLLWWVYLRSLHCANCGIRLGLRLYSLRFGVVWQSWLRQRCWNCGFDLWSADAATAARTRPAVAATPAARRRTLPINGPAVIVFVFGVGTLFVLDAPLRGLLVMLSGAPEQEPAVAGIGLAFLPLVFAFLFSTATLVSPGMRRFALPPGRAPAGARLILYAIAAVSALLILLELPAFAPPMGVG